MTDERAVVVVEPRGPLWLRRSFVVAALAYLTLLWLAAAFPFNCACTSLVTFARYPRIVLLTAPDPIFVALIPGATCASVTVPEICPNE